MARFLRVQGSKVEAVTLWDTAAPSRDGWVPAPNGVQAGWVVNGDGSYSPPAEAVPDPPTKREAHRAALNALVFSLPNDKGDIFVGPRALPEIRDAIDALMDPDWGRVQAIRWETTDGTAIRIQLAKLQEALKSGLTQAAVLNDDFTDA